MRDANFQPGRLDTLRTRNSAAYKAINVLIQRNGAQDFFWKSTIRELDETDWEECKLDIHHIFPQDWCSKQGIQPRKYDSVLNTQEYEGTGVGLAIVKMVAEKHGGRAWAESSPGTGSTFSLAFPNREAADS